MSEADDFLNGGSSVITAIWPTVGFTVEGTVVDWEMRQQTDMKTGELLFFKNKARLRESELHGNLTGAQPAMQMLLDLQGVPTGKTWKNNTYDETPVPDDDGMRRAYVKGELQKALREAMKEAGDAKLEKGAYVEIVRLPAMRKFANGSGYTFKARWTPAKDNAKAGEQFLSNAAPDPFGPQGVTPDPFAA